MKPTDFNDVVRAQLERIENILANNMDQKKPNFILISENNLFPSKSYG